jgi:hypothetical protein
MVDFHEKSPVFILTPMRRRGISVLLFSSEVRVHQWVAVGSPGIASSFANESLTPAILQDSAG